MKIEQRQENDVVILDLSGKLTIGQGGELLREQVENLVVCQNSINAGC